MEKKQNVFFIILVLSALFFTPFWQVTKSELIDPPSHLSYTDLRTVFAFRQFPIGNIEKYLNSKLDRSMPIALDGILATTDFFRQRLTEGLYPRVIKMDSPHKLQLVETSGGNKDLVLTGPDVSAPTAVNPVESFELSWIQFLFTFLAAIGLGLPLSLFFFPSAHFFSTILCAAFVQALIGSLATWFQITLPTMISPILGFCGLTIGVYIKKKREKLSFERFLSPFKDPVTLLFLIFFLIFILRNAYFPVSMWDGRSIWFFHAKRIFMQGLHFAKTDLMLPDAQWSHPDYPLLYPLWLSFFSSFSSVYNERMASLGISVLYFSLLHLFYHSARPSLGKLGAAVTAFFFFFASETFTEGGNVDAILMLSFIASFFLLKNKDTRIFGFFIMAFASLLKSEGIILAGVLIFLFLFFDVSFREFFFKPKAILALSFFSPAIIHRIWIKTLGLETVLKGKNLGEVLSQIPFRLMNLIPALPTVMENPSVLTTNLIHWVALLLFPLCLVFLLLKKKFLDTDIKILIGAIFLSFLFAFGSVLAIPEEVRWVASVTLNRLCLHGSALVILLASVTARKVL